jgi:hypothetical protein
MKILYSQYETRPYYDREGSHVILGYEGVGIGPHAAALRDTYSIPANFQAKVTNIGLTVVRKTAAAPVGAVRAYVYHNSTAGTYKIQVAELLKNAIGDDANVHIGEGLWLAPNDLIALYTEDLSTGGTIDYNLCVALIIFYQGL